MYYVYHLHTKGMGLDEGYIGISCNPTSRWAEHRRRVENPHLANAIKKYDVVFSIISAHETVEEALWQELTLRPTDHLGWNLAKGGGLPPNSGGWNKGKTTPDDVRLKQSEARVGRFSDKDHPRAKLANVYRVADGSLLAEGVVIRTWANENGYHQAHLAATASGKSKQHKGIYARYI